jgi:hypothetical protein
VHFSFEDKYFLAFLTLDPILYIFGILCKMHVNGAKLTQMFSYCTDYSKEVHSYLKYCKDVVFTGMTFSLEEEHLIDIFWDMYKGKEVMLLV